MHNHINNNLKQYIATTAALTSGVATSLQLQPKQPPYPHQQQPQLHLQLAAEAAITITTYQLHALLCASVNKQRQQKLSAGSNQHRKRMHECATCGARGANGGSV